MLLGDIEGSGQISISKNFKGLPVVGVEAFHLAGGVNVGLQFVHRCPESFAVHQAIQRHALKSHALGTGIGILVNEPHRGVRITNKAPGPGFTPCPVPSGVHERDVGRYARFGPMQLRDP